MKQTPGSAQGHIRSLPGGHSPIDTEARDVKRQRGNSHDLLWSHVSQKISKAGATHTTEGTVFVEEDEGIFATSLGVAMVAGVLDFFELFGKNLFFVTGKRCHDIPGMSVLDHCDQLPPVNFHLRNIVNVHFIVDVETTRGISKHISNGFVPS